MEYGGIQNTPEQFFYKYKDITLLSENLFQTPGIIKNRVLQADVVITDSKSQCKERGEIYQASKDGFLTSSALELGNIINGVDVGRANQEQITVADLTGVAVQDIQISKAILRNL